MISDDEVAAITAALMMLTPAVPQGLAPSDASRWKLADRQPELELEDLRAL
jgi:hypothetical protein